MAEGLRLPGAVPGVGAEPLAAPALRGAEPRQGAAAAARASAQPRSAAGRREGGLGI